MFPIGLCKYNLDFVDEKGISPHTHTTTSEIIQTHNSNGKIVINNHTYEFKKNGLYFIHGLTPHFIVPDNINQYNHSIAILNTTEIERLCLNLDIEKEYKAIFTEHGGTVCTLSDEDSIKVSSLFIKGQKILSDSHNMKYARLSSLFVDFLQIGLENTASKSDEVDSGLTLILAYINANLSNKLTIEDISQNCGLSKFYVCHFFKEKTGITIGNFIKGQRISLAKQLLTVENTLSVSVIAQKCGFTNSSFFSKVFTDEVGCTPTAFRAKYK